MKKWKALKFAVHPLSVLSLTSVQSVTIFSHAAGWKTVLRHVTVWKANTGWPEVAEATVSKFYHYTLLWTISVHIATVFIQRSSVMIGVTEGFHIEISCSLLIYWVRIPCPWELSSVCSIALLKPPKTITQCSKLQGFFQGHNLSAVEEITLPDFTWSYFKIVF